MTLWSGGWSPDSPLQMPFNGWACDSKPTFLLTIVAVICFGVAQELLPVLMVAASGKSHNAAVHIEAADGIYELPYEDTEQDTADLTAKQLLRASASHMLLVGWGMFAMLLIMTFNVWVCTAL